MKLCIDPGHGMGNRTVGVYDPGCVANGLNEADVVLTWAEELNKAVTARGIQTFLTRKNKVESRPVGARAKLAREAGCTHFISIHVNDAESILANGTETLYYNSDDLAKEVQAAAVSYLGLKDRGVKYRSDLAVLKFIGPCCLLELGFIQNPCDVKNFTNEHLRAHTCRAIAQIF